MSPILHFVTFVILFLTAAHPAPGQDKSDGTGSKTDRNIVRIQQILSESSIDTKEWPKEMSLAEVLKKLKAGLPKKKQIRLRIDEKAFGKDLSRIEDVRIRFGVQTMSLQAALRKALEKLPGEIEADYCIESSGITVTRSRLAAFSMIHSASGLVEDIPWLLPSLKKEMDLYQGLKPTDGPALLVRWLANETELRPWETIQLLNGVRLKVHASLRKQEEIAGLLFQLRRSTDVAVVMNARLYEVDRKFFSEHIAPILGGDKETEHGAAVRIDWPLFKMLTRQKLLLESEDTRIRPTRKETFLSHQSVVRYTAGLKPGPDGRAPAGTALAGVAFEVCPVLSGDRRHLRLRITEHVTQLVGIGKAKTLNASPGKEMEVEVPNLRRTSQSVTIQIPDMAPTLMPVNYPLLGKEHEDKVWLLVARPWVRIQEEVDIIQKKGEDASSKGVWNSEVHTEPDPPPAKPLPFNDEVREILQAVITDVLTNPELKHTREFYGTAKDKTLNLHDSENLGWPKAFKPDTHGLKLVNVKPDPFVDRRRILAIRIDKFDLKQKKTDLFEAPIDVCVFNGGGHANGSVIGGCHVYYVPKRVGKRWTVELNGLLDP